MRKKVEKKSLLQLFEDKTTKKVVIPDIQRDYVMGSGGDKLDNLLDSMNKCANNKSKFDFSSLVIQRKDGEMLIYDGQQRITTLVYLFAYLSMDKDLLSIISKFEFTGRKNANAILQLLCNPKNDAVKSERKFNASDLSRFNGATENNHDKNYITDFTTFSISNLLNKVNKYTSIDSDFLLNRVLFNCVEIPSDDDKKGDVEQFFMDLNSGVKLKDYELFKAKLNHKVENIKYQWIENGEAEKYKECLCNWPHRMDNQWLKFFEDFLSRKKSSSDMPQEIYYLTEEEIEIEFIKYCVQMVYLEDVCNKSNLGKEQGLSKSKNKEVTSVEQLTIKNIHRIYYIMENITKIRFCTYQKPKAEVLNYSWPLEKEDNEKYNGKDYRGAYWNLKYEDYTSMFYNHIDRLYFNSINRYKAISKGKESQEYKTFSKTMNQYRENCSKDVVLWCYISNVGMETIGLKWYLRIIKVLLNYNVEKNNEAWLYSELFGNYLCYCKYKVYGIPGYYSKDNTIFKEEKKMKEYVYSIYNLNSNINISNLKNIKDIIVEVKKHSKHEIQTNIDKITKLYLLEDYHNCWKKLEENSFVNGILDNFLFNDDGNWEDLKGYLTDNINPIDSLEKHFKFMREIYKIIAKQNQCYKKLLFDNVTVKYSDRTKDGGKKKDAIVFMSNLMDALYTKEVNNPVYAYKGLLDYILGEASTLNEWNGFWIGKDGNAQRPKGAKGVTIRRTYDSLKMSGGEYEVKNLQ